MNRLTRMNKLRGVLIDLSGTLHIEDTETPGAVEALKRLRKADLKVKFVTNTTKESKRVLLSRLHTIGFDVQPEEIFSSLTAARSLIDAKNLRPLLLVDDKAMEEFDGIPTDNPNAVVVGLAPDKFDYDSMNQAFRLVLDGAELVAVHKARYYQTKTGLCLGPGPFVQALEFATGRAASVVGKPQAQFFLASIADWGLPPASVAMIGDDARDDIQGAAEVGMQTFLVQTGKYRPGDEEKISPSPSVTVPSFSDAVELILSQRGPS